jgi:hypothetical protein
MSRHVIFWRRIDSHGLERLEISRKPEGVTAVSTVLSVNEGGFRMDYCWRLDPEWRTRSVSIERWNAAGHRALQIERADTGWRLNGAHQSELDLAEEIDLSITPFCNSFAIRKMEAATAASLTWDVVFIDGPDMKVSLSKQRYDRQEARRFRYVDLGVARGFEADLVVDDDGLILLYEGLFERLFT